MNPKQQIFCREFVLDLNGTQAAIRAGYSPTNATDTASRLMDDQEIVNHIETLLTERAQRVGVNADFVLQELVALARGADGATKLRALELLGKHLRMFVETIDVNIPLARKAEEYAKLPIADQIKLIKEELARLEGSGEPVG